MYRTVLIFLLLAPGFSQASILGEENIPLAKMVLSLQKIYTETRDLVKEATVQSEALVQVRDTIQTIQDDVDTVRNSFLWDIEAILKQDFDEVTRLDDMEGLSLKDKLITLKEELDVRLEKPDLDGDVIARMNQAKSLIQRELLLIELEKASKANLRAATHGVTDKEAAQITAQSAAIQAAVSAAEARAAASDRRRALHDTDLIDQVPLHAASIFNAAAE